MCLYPSGAKFRVAVILVGGDRRWPASGLLTEKSRASMNRAPIDAIRALRDETKLQDAASVLKSSSPVPKVAGLYAWFFREIPPSVPINDCVVRDCLPLLYVGIAPKRIGSKATLRSRIRQHYTSNAAGSTLRLTLGCLLSDRLDIRLRRVGKKDRLTFGPEGEKKLSDWMATNALTCWVENLHPWDVEGEVIAALRPPLNVEGNAAHPFCVTLSALRSQMKKAAREL